MFSKILIANRGEIACRVIATARQMGVQTVAVYSDADEKARHVAMADEAVRIGPAPVAESYLQAVRIIAAAKETGADAIHPGYGFLSENPEFVEAVEAAGLTFIGPPADAIRAMGLKDAAKARMEDAGVPVVPGYHGASRDPAQLAAKAETIGYPVLIKARAGGGGKGMRLVERPEDFGAALKSAEREAEASFGDPACLIEKYITQPRHVEIQIFADAHGNLVHLFERDCSLQRRHQKVIEEAPAPGMPQDVREAMGKAAVEAARAIGYQGAGTVEFIADGSDGLRTDGFWFMEMNTRLQVEHPVSEAITGLDFVALQLQVAAGMPLPFAQKDLRIDGHSFEARLYAEDVDAGFLPATGTLAHLAFPTADTFANGSVRVDSGVRQGDVISPFYDPMIAKVIVHGPDRATALARLRAALGACQVAGTVTNLAFLSALARHPGFAAGDVDTGLIGRDLMVLTTREPVSDMTVALAAIGALGLLAPHDPADPWAALVGWTAWGGSDWPITLEHEGTTLNKVVTVEKPGHFRVGDLALEVSQMEGAQVAILSDGRRISADIVTAERRVSVFQAGRADHFTWRDPLAVAEDTSGGDRILSPMPGLVRTVTAAPGDTVAAGDPLIVLEAMKMEHSLSAPRDGVVADVHVETGAQTEAGAVLLTLEPEDG